MSEVNPHMFEVNPRHGMEPSLEQTELNRDQEWPILAVGQGVVVSKGVLEGAIGTIVTPGIRGHYLIALGEKKGLWASIPAHVLRATDSAGGLRRR